MSLDKMTIANRYAKALFELVVEQDQLDSTFEELKQLRDVFQTNDNLAYLLTSVELSLQEKQSILKILTDGATPVVKNLIMMVFDYGRMDDMVAIIDEFERRYDSKKKRVHADVVTAVKLDATQKDQLSQTLAKKIDANEIMLSEQVDPSILGGVIIHANNETWDGSLSSKIEQIRRLLVK
ncbi:F0F1 ATP synthase subunit delta [Paucilactobacillus vaccinostercus DSM 20634]|jgi:F-type H+-transporting ATPase subunit delta|uniref:ATP synthase subunit delta n=1 Tax=Paucilactobacillus vaccinostercus DSM 20634 TaxID=1423813 RepID=A0A0R2ACR4_9LACO|nr:ATP synthase F1 subunit delta [Paucilactobacillus vaccinostercus]KRM60556.1 F0F1 ATP synthase subunit delta [Paucilactobacillus vaccinostercus DSM 20634]RRG09080.1 MAG: F0F1 ATP synthase subunit delta [Lactobacillus sp.]